MYHDNVSTYHGEFKDTAWWSHHHFESIVLRQTQRDNVNEQCICCLIIPFIYSVDFKFHMGIRDFP